MKRNPNLFSMQLNVPHSAYGTCQYFMPKVLGDWLKANGIEDYNYVGGGSWGNGFTNGVTNQESVYMVYDIQEEDGLAFKIQFPNCGVHVAKQYEY